MIPPVSVPLNLWPFQLEHVWASAAYPGPLGLFRVPAFRCPTAPPSMKPSYPVPADTLYTTLLCRCEQHDPGLPSRLSTGSLLFAPQRELRGVIVRPGEDRLRGFHSRGLLHMVSFIGDGEKVPARTWGVR